MKCKHCGKKISDDSQFCTSCGGRIKDSETMGQLKKDAAEKANTAKDTADGAGAAKNAKPKRWYKKTWLYIAAAVVIADAVLTVTGVSADIVAFVLEGPTIPISFDSIELEDAVRSQLDIWDREVTNKDAATVTELNLEGCGISGIEALSRFEDLTCLNLKSNQVSDLSPLADLTDMTELNLQENRITDITALSGLGSLTDLQLSDNEISDISVLSRMTCLNKLHLDKNQINDISPLAMLQDLKELDLSENKISVVKPLSGLCCLETLNLGGNLISDVEPISKLTEIKEIDLADNKISDISALAGCGGLTKLSLRNDPIEDIGPASQIDTLKSIDIRGTEVSDISDIAGKAEIEMDQPKTIEIGLMPGEYFMIEDLKLPIDTGEAQITWTSSDDSAVSVEEDGRIQATNVQTDAWYSSMCKLAFLKGKIKDLNTEIQCRVEVKCDPYGYEWDEKKTTYKYSGWKTTGYACVIAPALENVIGVDLNYEIEITKGKLNKFALRAQVNGKWKNFETIDVSEETEGTIHIDFEDTVKISKYWLVPKEKKSGQWNDFAVFDAVYYARREAGLGDLLVGAE
jgi:hypothetical protein